MHRSEELLSYIMVALHDACTWLDLIDQGTHAKVCESADWHGARLRGLAFRSRRIENYQPKGQSTAVGADSD
jgi:transposase